jgi:hypothetical protein
MPAFTLLTVLPWKIRAAFADALIEPASVPTVLFVPPDDDEPDEDEPPLEPEEPELPEDEPPDDELLEPPAVALKPTETPAFTSRAVYDPPAEKVKGPNIAGRSMPIPELFRLLSMLTPGPFSWKCGFVSSGSSTRTS